MRWKLLAKNNDTSDEGTVVIGPYNVRDFSSIRFALYGGGITAYVSWMDDSGDDNQVHSQQLNSLGSDVNDKTWVLPVKGPKVRIEMSWDASVTWSYELCALQTTVPSSRATRVERIDWMTTADLVRVVNDPNIDAAMSDGLQPDQTMSKRRVHGYNASVAATSTEAVAPSGVINFLTAVATIRVKSGGNAADKSAKFATATLTHDGTNVSDGDTVTINDQTYRFKNTMAQANDIQIGAAADDSLTNLYYAVDLSGSFGTHYFAGTVGVTGVAQSNLLVASDQATFSAETAGTAANSFVSTEASTHLSFGGTTFAGGQDAGAGAKSVNVIGIGADGVVLEESLVLNGASVGDASISTFLRILEAYVVYTGTYGAANTAEIVIESSGGTALTTIPAGKGRSADAYTAFGLVGVRAQFGFLRGLQFTVAGGDEVDIIGYSRESFTEFSGDGMRAKQQWGFWPAVTGSVHIPMCMAFDPAVDIWFEAYNPGGSASSVSVVADFDIASLEGF